MATHIYCDDKSHDENRFTPAVAFVRVQKRDPKQSNTILTTKNFDTCLEHMGDFVKIAYTHNVKDPLFERVIVDVITKSGD